MIEHIVLFKWKPEATPSQKEAVLAALRELPRRIPGIAYLSCGMNFCDRSQGFETGLVVRFEDRAALEAYGPHPAHQEVVQNVINPIRDQVIAVDYEIAGGE